MKISVKRVITILSISFLPNFWIVLRDPLNYAYSLASLKYVYSPIIAIL